MRSRGRVRGHLRWRADCCRRSEATTTMMRFEKGGYQPSMPRRHDFLPNRIRMCATLAANWINSLSRLVFGHWPQAAPSKCPRPSELLPLAHIGSSRHHHRPSHFRTRRIRGRSLSGAADGARLIEGTNHGIIRTSAQQTATRTTTTAATIKVTEITRSNRRTNNEHRTADSMTRPAGTSCMTVGSDYGDSRWQVQWHSRRWRSAALEGETAVRVKL